MLAFPHTIFHLIEAGSQIQDGSLTEAGDLRANTIELIAHPPVFRFAVINTKPRILAVLNTCSSVNRVVLIEAGGSDTIVLIEAFRLLSEEIEYTKRHNTISAANSIHKVYFRLLSFLHYLTAF